MKTIWIINEYAGSKYHGMEFRHYYLGRELVRKGYRVYVITASFSHLFTRLPHVESKYTIEKIDGIYYLWVKVPRYARAHDKRRILKWLVFSERLFGIPLDKIEVPDVIIVSPMAPFPVIAGYYFSLKFNTPLFYEVKDLWPRSIVEIGNYSRWNPLIIIMSWLEKFAYLRASRVISVLPHAREYMISRGMKPEKFAYIPNGFSGSRESESGEAVKEELGFLLPDKFLVGYTGTLGAANAMEYFLDAAKILLPHSDIHFVLVGDGQERGRLMMKVTQDSLSNVTFLGPIPKEDVQVVLGRFDVCYIGWRKRKIYDFGISANKIFEYMYAGRPILHSYSGNGDLVSLAQCGLTVEAENPSAIADAVLKLKEMGPQARDNLGSVGREYVTKNHSYDTLSNKLIEMVEGVAPSSHSERLILTSASNH